MRTALKWVLLFLVPVVALSLAGQHLPAQTIAQYAPHVLGGAVLAPALLHGLSAITMLRTADMPAVTLEAKSRKATDLRGKANALMAEILNDDKLTAEQCRAKSTEAKDLMERADMIAGFTASDEIARQGGTGDLVTQVAGSEHTDVETRATGRETLGFEPYAIQKPLVEQVRAHTQDVLRGFGSVREFLRVAQGRDPVDTTNAARAKFQYRVLKQNLDLQRAIIGTAGDISGGSFLLPLTQVQSIFSLANVQQGLL